MSYKHFVLPFTIGLILLLLYLMVKYTIWIIKLSKPDKNKVLRNIFTYRSLLAFNEVIFESLLHRKIIKKHVILGFMHMSLAFGWFLLIVFGHIETYLYYGKLSNPVYIPIFFDYFIHDKTSMLFGKVMVMLMDLFLLFVLSGVALAYYKRYKSRFFGMKKTTSLKLGDKFALFALWLIFPLRLLAESVTSGIHETGGFITRPLGEWVVYYFPVQNFEDVTWWAYSFSLGIFFIALPFSRYMHIPTEILLIFLRRMGIKSKKEFDSFADIELHSCSSCGICIDSCQISSLGINEKTPSAYFLKSVRNKEPDEKEVFDCLLCGRCEQDCPVGISTTNQRIAQRVKMACENQGDYSYIKNSMPKNKVDVIYFAGCMSHLTPGIIKSMKTIFELAQINYNFMDEDGTACCGRPQILAGQMDAAKQLMNINKNYILSSGAKLLVTSCPICYRIFKEDYNLDIEVQHHTQYLNNLIKNDKLNIHKSGSRIVYHDPCELGRGMGIYKEPRELLNKIASLQKTKYEKENALCCGGSLGNLVMDNYKRTLITNDVVNELSKSEPDYIVTACPLCKKTFVKVSDVQVLDIAEILTKAITRKTEKQKIYEDMQVLQEEIV